MESIVHILPVQVLVLALVVILAVVHLVHHEVDTVVAVHQVEAALSAVTVVVEADVDVAEL